MAKVLLSIDLNAFDAPEAAALSWLKEKNQKLNAGVISQKEFDSSIKDLLMTGMHIGKINSKAIPRLANNLDAPLSANRVGELLGVKAPNQPIPRHSSTSSVIIGGNTSHQQITELTDSPTKHVVSRPQGKTEALEQTVASKLSQSGQSALDAVKGRNLF
ncbi:hypothetical protein AB4571_16250 [Vibrio breoganii]|uniref:hypothetical protein n=2 Tax=Vibrio TaxID=662 RepID=UPI000C84C911|nr:hypothetical protein [Vibrio breoganii]PML12815.1 hypothetical protein BCT84_02715 [Vibrio breoganii]